MITRKGAFKSGPQGTATEVLVELGGSDPKDWQAGVGNWFIDAPGQSAAWRHYMLSAVHLRPIAGVKPAVVRRPGATHEFMLLAMDPGKHPVALQPSSWSYLTPQNLAEQMICGSDAVATKLLACCAAEMVQGVLWAEPPLSGQFEPWRAYLEYWSSALSTQ